MSDLEYLKIADLVAGMGHHSRFKIGAVLVDPYGRIVSSGVNVEGRYHAEFATIFPMADHGEQYAKTPINCTMYINAPPCNRCAGLIISANIVRVVCFAPWDDFKLTWNDVCLEGEQILTNNGVSYLMIDRP